MDAFVLLCTLSLVGSYSIVEGVRRWACSHLIDIPNERSSHTVPTPRGGGVGIVLMTVIPLLAAIPLMDMMISGEIVLVLIAAILIALLGWIDDRFVLSAKTRLLVQTIISFAAVVSVGIVDHVMLPFVGSLSLPALVATMLCVFWIVAFTNIYNFMDGIDGISATQAIVAAIGWFVLLLIHGQFVLALASALIAASSMGFLSLNRPPARIFMGDVGSTFLGFFLALLPVTIYQEVADPRFFGAGVLMVAPFVLDGAFTIVRRLLRGENVLRAHRSHIYQRLVKLGYSHAAITNLYGLFALASIGCALLYALSSDVQVIAMAISAPILVFTVLVLWTTWMERRTANATVERTSLTEQVSQS